MRAGQLRTPRECAAVIPLSPRRPSLRRPKGDIAVLGASLLARLVGVGHHPHRDDVPGFLAEGKAVVLEYVAPELVPFADAVAAAVDDNHLDLVGVVIRGDGADRGAT